MRRGRHLDPWEMGAAALASGLLAQVAPWLVGLALAAALAALLRDERIEIRGGAPLLALAGVAAAALLWGGAGAVAAALAWRTVHEVAQGADPPRAAHVFMAPAAALAYRLECPILLTAGLGCLACVAWLDWIIRRLADWRLASGTQSGDPAFLGAQASSLVILLALPSPLACIAAFATLALVRHVRWPARPRYATAR
ncbi:MAG: hypothetical protein NW200_04520 [Hyphomonadaceae bacterium]|nr:hypothetical protein [Hyphomonadaceae bacterium]